VRRFLAWLAGALGGIALYRAATRRGSAVSPLPAPEPAPQPLEPQPDPRAKELRRKLEESRTLVNERDEFESGETTVDEAQAGQSPDDRRRRVHEEARAQVERMRSTPTD
jgi:hypothetical protein